VHSVLVLSSLVSAVSHPAVHASARQAATVSPASGDLAALLLTLGMLCCGALLMLVSAYVLRHSGRAR